jgi:hypothetical protein
MDKQSTPFFPSAPVPSAPKLKCPDLPVLQSYSFPPDPAFWDIFPSRPLPECPTTPINIQGLKNLVTEVEQILTLDQAIRASLLIEELSNGSPAPLSYELPPLRVPNTHSAVTFGAEFTDTVGYWIRTGYVAGPFSAPPYQGFRSNSMIALEQKDKVRIIMDLSSPKGKSFNDCVDELSLEKVNMSTARQFGYTVVECGTGARMYKWDLVDAYKNIPVPIYQIKFQGFRWLGKYYAETQKVFGDKSSVAAFDRLGKTCVDLACLLSNTPESLIHRTLDDTPLVVPADSNIGKNFKAAYEHVCNTVNARLAPPCPKNEKAFCDKTKGTVLGIVFDSEKLLWSLSNEKATRILLRIKGPLLGDSLSLSETQKLLGSLNDVGQMCSFLRGFRHTLQQFLTEFENDEYVRRPLPAQARDDLRVWAAAVADATKGQPIPHRPINFSLAAKTFVSDAAGAQFSRQGEKFIPYCTDKYRGAACVSEDDSGIWFCSRLSWPKRFLLEARDEKDHAYGCKSSTLEAIGILLPSLCCPEKIAGGEVILLTDNESLVYGWGSRKITNDTSASILIRTIHIISFYLGCSVTIEHLPRRSTTLAELVDDLSRSSTTSISQLQLIRKAYSLPVPQVLENWLLNPSEDWTLPLKLLDHVKSVINL